MPITIETVEFGSELYKATLHVRYEVLRKPIGMELRPKDVALDHSEYHIAALDSGNAIGCVLLRPLEGTTIQLRQMAVMYDYQGQGIGAKLVKYAQAHAARKGFRTMVTKARKTAQGFYEKLGYLPSGDDMLDDDVNVHILKMSKSL